MQNLRVQVQSAVQYTFYIVYTVIDFLRICSFFFTMHVEHKHPHHRRLFDRYLFVNQKLKIHWRRATDYHPERQTLQKQSTPINNECQNM